MKKRLPVQLKWKRAGIFKAANASLALRTRDESGGEEKNTQKEGKNKCHMLHLGWLQTAYYNICLVEF